MPKMTITEALAEIKLINSKLEKKRTRVLSHLVRRTDQDDPLKAEGGSVNFIASEIQAIVALESNIIAIRAAIMSANLHHSAEVMGKTKTLFEWLVWKREVVENIKKFYDSIYKNAKFEVEKSRANPSVKMKPDQNTIPELVLVEPNLNYMEFSKKHEEVCDMLAKLDGILSLKNATIVVEIHL
jgi:hypothetical protein